MKRIVVGEFSKSYLLLLATFLAASAFSPDASAQAGVCAPIVKPGHYGPFDYLTDQSRLEIVERFHFTPKVEALIAGQSDYLGGDISYTLDAFPNHHRALNSLIRWHVRTKSLQPPYLRLSIECYFDRALRFRPRDTVTRSLFAVYLGHLGRKEEALRQLGVAAEHAETNGLSQHNIGLVFLDLGDAQSALRQAHLARKLGFEGTLLIDKLKAGGQWKEAVE